MCTQIHSSLRHDGCIINISLYYQSIRRLLFKQKPVLIYSIALFCKILMSSLAFNIPYELIFLILKIINKQLTKPYLNILALMLYFK